MNEWEDLVDRRLFGELSESEMKRFAELLDSDSSLRKNFVERATRDTELADVIRGAGEYSADPEVMHTREDEIPNRRTNRVMRFLLAVAATVIFVLSFALLNERSRTAPVVADASNGSIAQISGLSGSLIWTGDRGQMLREITEGTELSGGTIEGLSPDAWFELRFNDGSKVTISGTSMLTFSDAGQKRLRLREGRMSADVAQQPVGNPMIIQTRTATLTVLGTSFDVEADLPATAVSVREGTVRVTRSSDGKEIDVPANHRVVAAADQDFERRQIAAVISHWTSRIGQGPDETFGKWMAATKTDPAFLKAVAFVPEEAPNVVLYLLGLGVRSEEGAPIQVDVDSHFQIRGKIDIETDVYFGIQVADANGDYAGKFLARCSVERNASGDFVANARLFEFGLDPSVAAYKHKLATSPEGLFVNGAWSFTHSPKPSGLRLNEVQLTKRLQK